MYQRRSGLGDGRFPGADKDDGQIGKKGKSWVFGSLLALVIVIGVAAFASGGRCEIEGATPGDRIESICRLASEKPRGAGDAIAEAAASAEEDPSVQQAALVAMEAFVEPKYREVVEKGLANTDAHIRAAAAATLGLYCDEQSADRLGDMATTDPAQPARIGAVIGLARNTCPRATAWLVRVIEENADMTVQFHAVSELYAKVGTRYAGPRPENAPDWPGQMAFVVEWLKGHPDVQKGYREASWTMVRRPEDNPHDH